MASIKKWLEENGFDFRAVTMNNGRPGIMVNTDYEGYYPTKDCLNKQQLIMQKVKRCKSLQAESRGYCTAVLIREAM